MHTNNMGTISPMNAYFRIQLDAGESGVAKVRFSDSRVWSRRGRRGWNRFVVRLSFYATFSVVAWSPPFPFANTWAFRICAYRPRRPTTKQSVRLRVQAPPPAPCALGVVAVDDVSVTESPYWKSEEDLASDCWSIPPPRIVPDRIAGRRGHRPHLSHIIVVIAADSRRSLVRGDPNSGRICHDRCPDNDGRLLIVCWMTRVRMVSGRWKCCHGCDTARRRNCCCCSGWCHDGRRRGESLGVSDLAVVVLILLAVMLLLLMRAPSAPAMLPASTGSGSDPDFPFSCTNQ